MAAAETASSAARVKYAPEDPTLPKPWRGLVDGNTGYLYFWNPETNVTQYEKPVASTPASPGPLQESQSLSLQKSPENHSKGDVEDGGDKAGNGGLTNVTSEAGTHQVSQEPAGEKTDFKLNDPDVKTGAAQGAFAYKGAETGLTAEEYCRRHEITVTGDNVPKPYTSFEATGFPSELLREVRYLLQEELNVVHCATSFRGVSCDCHFFICEPIYWKARNAGFSAPTPIQAQSWPVALQGRDIVAIAKTGSGKTLGYLIPGFIHLKRKGNNPRLGPTVLVLSPTRELATQIQDEAVKFGRSSKITSTCLYGGAPKGPQLKDLDRGVDIVVATPGRLNDILEMKRVSLHQVSYLVLDEADRMLDMGFEPQIRKIVKEAPSRRQTLMYTATWPHVVRRIAADLLINPVQVNIGNVDELAANKSIKQYVEVLSPMDKRRRLEQILRSQEPGSKIIIFCSTKRMCDQLADNLSRPFGAAAIHGDKSQSERDHVLNQFRSGRSPVLVATDVAARGLDVKDIRVVINYDFPTGIEDYVHRIGRTGRAGATGEAYTFFCDQNAKYAADLVKLLEGADQKVPAEVRDMASRGGGMGYTRSQWGSSPSGHDGGGGRGGGYNSSYHGGGSYNQERNDRYGSGSFGNDANATGSSQYKSFHESMMAAAAAAKNEVTNRSRSRSPTRNLCWGDNNGSPHNPSPTSERFNGATPVKLSFHEMMMQQARPSGNAESGN